jgi:hypothetical protein
LPIPTLEAGCKVRLLSEAIEVEPIVRAANAFGAKKRLEAITARAIRDPRRVMSMFLNLILVRKQSGENAYLNYSKLEDFVKLQEKLIVGQFEILSQCLLVRPIETDPLLKNLTNCTELLI